MYTERESPPKNVRKELEIYDDITQKLLYARGIKTKEKAEYFFNKNWRKIDPYIYKDMIKAVSRTIKAFENKENIGIFSDYDCDGIPSAAALYCAINAYDHKNVFNYIPDRNIDGFGLNKKGINFMIKKEVKLLFVLDCGTSSPIEINKLIDNNIDVIVIDHHLPGELCPIPFAMINPTIEENVVEPYQCTGGLVYIFLQALIEKSEKENLKTKPKVGWEKWQLDILGMSTISDMVPLFGINRQIVHWGMHVSQKSSRPGLQALFNKLNINQNKITQDDFSFSIIPRINAASRMSEANIAFKLLTTSSIEEAFEIVDRLTFLNNKRKATTANIIKNINKIIKNKSKDKEVWVFGDRKWKPAFAGLVAQKISVEHDKIVFVWGQDENEEITSIKGSCRSKHYNTFNMMKKLPDVFSECGGHAFAGGFVLNPGAEIDIEDKLNSVVIKKERIKVEYVDCVCKISDIENIIKISEKFSPFGFCNEEIKVAIKCKLDKISSFGKTREHKKYIFYDNEEKLEGIKFFVKDENLIEGANCTVIGVLKKNTFKKGIQIKVIKILM